MGDNSDLQLQDGKTICNILENYVQNEKALVNQLYFKTSHGATIGGFREDIWRGMFEQIVPKKFVIEQSVFIIDSCGRVSNEVDLAIFDETYTPYIFRYGRLKFLPIEAVAVAIECKSKSLDNEKLKKWAESIAALKTSCKSYTRTIREIIIGEINQSPTQSATRPLRILCCLNEGIVNEKFASGDKLFDIVVRAVNEKEQRLTIEIDEEKKNLQKWYLELNHAVCRSEDAIKGSENISSIKMEDYQVNCQCKNEAVQVALLTLNLQLNQLLMLINNPILFPHMAYAEMFNKFGKDCNLYDE